MSLTILGGKTLTLTSTDPTLTPTMDPLGHPLIAPDAVRFLIIAATVAVFFGSVTCLCCLTYRIRKAKMRRVVVAAFEQNSKGVFDRELVRERIAWMHRGDPYFDLMFPNARSGIPEYFDKLGRPCGMGGVDGDAKVGHANMSVEGSFQPLSAQVQVVPTSVAELKPHPHLSSLPLEEQLALLFHASRHKEERKRRKLERPPNDPLANAEQKPELVLSVLITMPRTRQLPEGGDGDLAFGTTGFRWHYDVAAPTSQVTAAVSNDDGALAPARL